MPRWVITRQTRYSGCGDTHVGWIQRDAQPRTGCGRSRSRVPWPFGGLSFCRVQQPRTARRRVAQQVARSLVSSASRADFNSNPRRHAVHGTFLRHPSGDYPCNLFGLAAIAILALLPLVARDRLAGGPIIYGILFAGFGTGACIAGLNNRLLRKLLPPEWLMAIASIASAVCCISLAFTSYVPMATLALAIGGAGWVITWTGFDVWVQLGSPRWVVGRTLSIYYAFLSGGMAAGSWIWGTVAQTYSLASSLELAAAALFLFAASGFVLPVHLEAEGDQQGSVYPAPAVALDLKPRNGPIAARTEYSIDETDLDIFLDHMRTRRYALARAGARDWTLQRNLRKPSRWTETFRTPTWMDFLRLHHRLSPSDQQVVQLLADFHMSDKPPETDLVIERTTDARRTRSQPAARVSRP